MITYDAIANEAWSRLKEAADNPSHPMRLMILASIGPQGSPDARLMVLRGADRRLARLWFYTDRRSEKVRQLKKRPALCVVAYDSGQLLQLRAHGTARIHESDASARRHWRQVSMSLQALLASPHPPGRPLQHPDPRLMGIKQCLEADDEDIAMSNFAVIEMAVRDLEWHHVGENDQQRAIMHSATGWAVQPLAP